MGPKASASPAQKMSAQLQAAAGTGSVQKVAQAIKKGARADILSPKEPYSAVIASVRYCLKHRDSAAALEVNQARPCQTCFAAGALSQVVKLILTSDIGADPNELDADFGWTPLTAAAFKVRDYRRCIRAAGLWQSCWTSAR